MMQTEFSYQGSDGLEIYAVKWGGESSEKPRAIVQISHGMAEHVKRYDSFARVLVSQNIFVYGNDHRGHGMTGSKTNSIGYFADEEGFERVVNDMEALTSIIEKEYPGVPIFLFGHSMGSFLSRRYIQLYGNRLAGVILSGTGGDPGIIGKIGKMIAAREKKKKGSRTPSPLMNKLTFGSYNKAFKPTRTDFDWLSRDEQEVDMYIADPLCGGVFTAGFYYDLLEGLETVNKPENIMATPASLPIFLISGSKDPVGGDTKGVLKSFQAYKAEGMQNVTYKFYEGARHELLNETNREEVQDDVIHWIDTHLRSIG
jgi:alpha-beta hydrolase superfamily lysophospholipase